MRLRHGALSAVLATALAAAVAPASASAALDFQPCTEPAGVECASIDVPIDRNGKVPGTFTLLVHRIPAPVPSGRPPLVFLAGGPGQTNTDLTLAAVERFGGALGQRDLIVFAQRGTGPGEIHCPELEAGAAPVDAMPACAHQLGAARNFYTSRDAADDLDDIRAALGVDKIAIATASYGTWVAQGYAIRHPQHVERMMLDSTVGPDQNADPFGVAQFKEAPALARALCHRHFCDGISDDPYDDLIELFGRLTTTPLKANVYGPKGGRKQVTLSPLLVANQITELDVNPHLRAELPRAIASALKGNGALLARLLAGGPVGPPPDQRGAINQTVNRITHCEEDTHPFDRTARPADRIAQARDNLATIPAETFAPFGPEIAFLVSGVQGCAFWQMAPDPPSFDSGPPADVPVLLIHGEFDLRSSFASTLTVAKQFRQGKILIVPNAGHSPTRFEVSTCARAAAVEWLTTGFPPNPCRPGDDPFAPRPLVPRSVKAAGGPLAAAQLTVADAFDELDAGSLLRPAEERRVRGGGLRGGWFRGSTKGLGLHGYRFIRGFPVTGLVRLSGKVLLKFPHGRLRFTDDGKYTGRIRGRKVEGEAGVQRLSTGALLANGDTD